MKLRKLKKTRTWYASKMSKTHNRWFFGHMYIYGKYISTVALFPKTLYK